MIRKQGRVRITYQLLREILGLPPEVIITDFGADPTRQILDVFITPKEDEHIRGLTFDVSEGAEVPVANSLRSSDEEINEVHYHIYEMVRNKLIGAEPDPDENEEETR